MILFQSTPPPHLDVSGVRPMYQVYMPMVSKDGTTSVEVAAAGMVTERVKLVWLKPTILVTNDEGLFEEWTHKAWIEVDGVPYRYVEGFVYDNTTALFEPYLYIFVYVDNKWFGASYEPLYNKLFVTERTIGQ